ncbi:4-coumarate--CoA ligase 1-like [Vespa velutina]|uniref:4-coumarate--CoA ligase 1-like n=1 Tax=Vespa velutina TaxID=202808 RepID=UPI001FB4BAF3|nr:4-coumarate--CoA ligase 1-like [Vespa velutina]XP_047350472.1 4-coumarate--CoA ligase 1-like [Vespa velutina]XP_047350481.1 4-coumarate--CoA ligase 1-like [Vespa velutina]XP_047350492.1 4-coumarate--CoA ligase 1-like [Vespa velutina]
MEDNKNILCGPSSSTKGLIHNNIGELLLNQLHAHGTRIAQINAHTGEKQTYQEILNASKRLATYFSKIGLKIEDRIAICSENNIEFCIPLCAALFLGITVCPLNPMYLKREFYHALTISKPKYIFTSSMAVNTLQEVIKQLPWSPKLVILTAYNNLPNMKDLILNIDTNEINNFQVCNIDVNNNVAAILCSSGTTGLPKGVMLTNKNLLLAIKHFSNPEIGPMHKDTIALYMLPYFHAYSFSTLLVGLIVGAKGIILARFEEKLFLHTIEKYKIEALTLVPPLMVFLAKHPFVDRYDLSSIKTIWCGAASLPEEIQKAVAKRLNVSNIKQGYGLTETTLAVLQSPSNHKYGSVGVVAPDTLAKVIPIDEPNSNKALEANCKGELCFKGDLIMKGYCDDSKSTSTIIDKDGWLHTGDVGYYDEDGFFYIVDRLKELIKYKGFQVPPAELEAVLLTCPGIKDAAVVGLPDEEAGELPLAFVVRQNRSKITEDEIIKYVNEQVSCHKRLRGGVKFVKDIPKTASGKILRRVLRNMVKSKL